MLQTYTYAFTLQQSLAAVARCANAIAFLTTHPKFRVARKTVSSQFTTQSKLR